MLFLALGPALLPALQTPGQRPVDLDEERPRTRIFYDYVEDGRLRGGALPIDPANPLHADTGTVLLTATSPSTTLLDNGPPANRIDLVFVGDGYTTAQLGQYALDVAAVWPTFLAEPPLANYATYFNVHRVDVTSPQSGVDHDPNQGIYRQTALDMGYWCSGIQRLLCVDVQKANAQANNAPGKDSILALANSSTYGGAGYSDLGTLAGRNSSAIEIALHEFGHSFAALADEYEYGGPTTFSGPEPTEKNVSTLDEAGLLAENKKWVLWLDLPHFGAFEGGMYSYFGIHRPTSDSKMRNLGRPFEEFNGERFIRFIYGVVRPIDAATPAGRYPLGASFFVDPMDPVGHSLDVQWSLDGVPISGANATTFDAGTLGLPDGQYELSVEVVDNTPMVRSQALRTNWMTDTRSWTLSPAGKRALHGAPGGPVESPGESPGLALTLSGSAAPGGELSFEVARPCAAGEVAWLFLSTSRSDGPCGRGVHLGRGLLASVGGAPAGLAGTRWTVALPRDPALSDRTMFAQAVFCAPAAPPGHRLWSDTLAFGLER